jgi:hypothetical protein
MTTATHPRSTIRLADFFEDKSFSFEEEARDSGVLEGSSLGDLRGDRGRKDRQE